MSGPRFPTGLVIAIIFIFLFAFVELVTYFCIRRRMGLKDSTSRAESRIEAGGLGSSEVNFGCVILELQNESSSIIPQGNASVQVVGLGGTPSLQIPDTGLSMAQGRGLSEVATQEDTRTAYPWEHLAEPPERGERRPAVLQMGSATRAQASGAPTMISIEHQLSPSSMMPLPSPTYPDSVYTAPNRALSNYQLPSISDDTASLPSTMYPDSIYPVSTLPSYPGTARSASPPAYSHLSRPRSRRTLGSSRAVSYYAESIPELTLDPTHLEERILGV